MNDNTCQVILSDEDPMRITPKLHNETCEVNHPSHYNFGKIEVIEFIEDQKLGMHLGNAVKYIARAGKKDTNKTIEDLNKAVWYIKRQIELLKAEQEKREAVRPNEMSNT